VVTTLATGDSCCGVNTSSPEVLVKIGDTIGCGVVFYISPDWEFALICAFDHLTSQYGCYGQTIGVATPTYNGTNGTNALIAAGCDIGTTIDNYSYGNCDDWYVGASTEMQLLFIDNFNTVNQTLSNLGFLPLLSQSYYWLPNEVSQYSAWCFQLNSSGQFFSTTSGKTTQRRLRPIRRHFF
jgi:hypothetical protein